MRFGLALSGGGIRGVAHIGVLKALEEEGRVPSWIAGTSAGSIVAGLYAYGYSTQELVEIAVDLQPKYIDPNFSGMALGFGQWIMGMEPCVDGLVKGKAIEKYLKKITGGIKMSDIKMPLAITAVDINKADSVIFLNRRIDIPADDDTVYIYDMDLYKAIRASIAIPVVLSPLL